MAGFTDDLIAILTSEAFGNYLKTSKLKLVEVDVILALLVNACIPFDLTFSPGTRRLVPAFQLTIFLNPTTKLGFTINLDGGASIFNIIAR